MAHFLKKLHNFYAQSFAALVHLELHWSLWSPWSLWSLCFCLLRRIHPTGLDRRMRAVRKSLTEAEYQKTLGQIERR